jgi:hypothetical protein
MPHLHNYAVITSCADMTMSCKTAYWQPNFQIVAAHDVPPSAFVADPPSSAVLGSQPCSSASALPSTSVSPAPCKFDDSDQPNWLVIDFRSLVLLLLVIPADTAVYITGLVPSVAT